LYPSIHQSVWKGYRAWSMFHYSQQLKFSSHHGLEPTSHVRRNSNGYSHFYSTFCTAFDMLEDNICKIISAQVETSNKVEDFLHIDTGSLNLTISIRILLRDAGVSPKHKPIILSITLVLHLLCGCFALCGSVCHEPPCHSLQLNYWTPMEALTGQTPDISPLLSFHFLEQVYYLDPSNESFPSATKQKIKYICWNC